MIALRPLAAALACAALTSPPAAAEEPGAGARYDRTTYPYGELVRQPLTLPRTMVRVDLPVHVNVAVDEVGKPWYVPAAVDVGVSDDVQLGIFHFIGLCPAGRDRGCSQVYDDVGARAAVSLLRTPASQLALEANALAFDLRSARLRAGLALAWKRSLSIAAVELRAGADAFVTDRDEMPFGELAFGEAAGALQLGEGFAAFVRARVEKALEVAPRASIPLRVPVTIGAEGVPVRRVAVGAALDFTNLLGEEASAEERTLVVYLRLTL